MKYLKVFTDFTEDIRALNDAETGRLFKAMLSYAATGEEPTFTGNEKYCWGTAKKNIDSQKKSYDAKISNMERARESNPNNKQTVNSSLLNNNEQKTVEEKEHEQEQEQKIRKKKIYNPPTLDEVQAYCEERHSSVDPVQFFEYFQEGNWKDSEGKPVIAWKQKLLTWEKFNAKKRNRAAQELDASYDMMRRWANG